MNRTLLYGALILTALLLGLHLYALSTFLYWTHRWFDIPMHMLGGLAIGLFLLSFLGTRRASLYFFLMLGVTVVWELFEYMAGISTGQPNYWLDTTKDIADGVIGSGIAFLIAKEIHKNIDMALKLTFSGGAESVTGSNFLVEGPKGKLLVDCGIEQGRDFCQECMYAPFPYDVPSVNALVITHAHLDHIGRVPKLMKEGFKGKIFMTAPTRDLTQLILEDSARIMAEDARQKGLPLLYEERDVEAAMSRVEIVEYHKEWEAAPGLSCFLRNTGHILGSASVRIRDTESDVTLALTGDIGNSPSPYLPDPEAIPDADVMVMESVYGDRLHTHVDERVDELQKALSAAIERGGTILIPAFSLERTQLMLYEISNLMDAGKLPKIPVFLDSPLAIKATDVYAKWGSEFFKPAVQDELHREHDIFRFPMLTQTLTREESEKIVEAQEPKIIMAGAGMSHGGRIGRWEQKYLPDPKTTLFIVGYQAPGSPGRLLQDGAKQVRLAGNDVTIRAHIQSFSGWSAHTDRDGLLKFAEMTKPRTKTIFTALGEPSSARFLAQRIHDYLGIKAIVPTENQMWEITKDGVTLLKSNTKK